MKTEQKNDVTERPLLFSSFQPDWKVFAAYGLLSIMFSLLTIFMPLPTLYTMALLFGIYATLDGIFSLISGINKALHGKHWIGFILSGITSLVIGIYSLAMPQSVGVSINLLIWITIAVWSIATGAYLVFVFIVLIYRIQGHWLLLVNGILHASLGIFILLLIYFEPFFVPIATYILVGGSFFAFGLTWLILALKLYKKQYVIPYL